MILESEENSLGIVCELTFIRPLWLSTDIYKDMNEAEKTYYRSMQYVEKAYLNLINEGWKAEEARNVLPLSTKTEVIMCGFDSDWKHFFDLRADGITGKPHPQAQELAQPLKEKFIENGWYP